MPLTTAEPAGLLGGYPAPAGVYDEFFSADEARPHVRPFVDRIDRLGREDLTRRWQQAERLLVENGITHNAYDAGGRLRPWRLDGLPLLLPPAEWDALAEGLKQRTS